MANAVVRLDAARSACALIGVALTMGGGLAEAAQPPAPAASAASARGPARNEGVDWAKLSPAHRQALAPLERDWPQMEAPRKLKWIEVAQRMPTMPAEERERIQARMAEWARMTPVERGQARLRYLQARRIAPDDRDIRWEEYQALSTDEKQQLAAKAAAPASAPGSTRKAVAERSARLDRADAKGPTTKSNLVTNPNFAAPPRAVTATVMQARPGATTTLVSKPPTPPAHQQIGLPKIAASPSFVDKATLLPIRGPQGAATVSVNTSDTDAEPVPRP